MSEIRLGQFIKNALDFSTGKMPAKTSGQLNNEKFQEIQKQANQELNKTIKNITQNLIQHQDIANTQMQLKELSNLEKKLLLKNLFNMPESMQDLIKMLATNNKQITQNELKLLLSQNIEISKLIEFLQTNGKEALSKISKMIATMNQSGIFETHQLKDVQNLINACIPVADASSTQIIKTFMIMYLPWIPISETKDFENTNDTDEMEINKSTDDFITILVTTKNYSIIKVLLYKEESNINIDITCCEKFPKESLKDELKSQSNLISLDSSISFSTRKDVNTTEQTEPKVEFSKTNNISPLLLYIIHLIIKLILEIDNKTSLQEKRKESL